MTKTIQESRALQVTEADTTTGRIKVGLITPGWGSSGYYSPQVLEAAGTAKVFPAGTQMFLDHPGEAEAYDRPERSVRDLAAVLTEDAVWDPNLDGGTLVGEAQVFGPYLDLLTDKDFTKAIGVSIRAYAESRVGEAEGRKGRIVTELTESVSADFVTRAGRGGSILQVLESARPARVVARAITAGVSEATANATRTALDDALRDQFGGEKSWIWVRDFDDTTVWYEHETPDESGTYQVAYQLQDNGTALLDGEPVEVRVTTTYVPVSSTADESAAPFAPAPAGQSTATESEETNMATTQIEESRLAQLEKDAERANALESEKTAADERAAVAERKLRDRDNTDAANKIIDAEATESQVSFTALERRGLLAGMTVTAEGDLDKDAFTEAIKTASAEKATESGAGSVTGFGQTTSKTDTDVIAEAEKAAAGAFGRTVKEA